MGLSPRERYKEEMDGIKKANDVAEGKDDQEELNEMADEELERLEDDLDKVNLDKNMGSVSEPVTMTYQDFSKEKALEAHNKALAEFKKANIDHLSNQDKKDMQVVLNGYRSNEIEDPVLKHLISQKGELAKLYMDDSKKVKEMYQTLLKEMTDLTNNIMKTKGAIENIDKQILQVYRRGKCS
jgi:hypothetical protein